MTSLGPIEARLRIALDEAARGLVRDALDEPRVVKRSISAPVSRRGPIVAVAAVLAVAAFLFGVAAVWSGLDGRDQRANAPGLLGEVSVGQLPAPQADVIVSMPINATPADIAAAREVVTATPAVGAFAYVSPTAALEELEKTKPEVARTLTAHDLPASFRAVARSCAARTALLDALSGIPRANAVTLQDAVSADAPHSPRCKEPSAETTDLAQGSCPLRAEDTQVFDHGVGRLVAVDPVEFCRDWREAIPYSAEQLRTAGVSASLAYENGHVVPHYVEIRSESVSGGTVDGDAAPLSVAEVEARIRAMSGP